MPYTVRIEPAAARDLKHVPAGPRSDIVEAIHALADHPRPPGTERIQGMRAAYLRIRIGSHRVVYHVDDSAHVVTVLVIGDRSDVYEIMRRRMR